MIAEALGVLSEATEDTCAMCGGSWTSTEGPLARVLGAKFTDHALLEAPSSATICRGCARLLAGRPGDDPPPLRTTSFAVVEGELHVLKRAELWPLIDAPPDREHVLSWSEGGKRHHGLRAGVSTPERQLVGSDQGTIVHEPHRDAALRTAVVALLAGRGGKPTLCRASVLTGEYSPSAVARYGVARWQRHEAVVAPRRSEPLVRLLCACAPVTEDHDQEETVPLDPIDREAASLIALIAEHSEVRRSDGLTFWGGFLQHRLVRFARRPLADTVARLLDECRVPSARAGSVTRALAHYDDEQASGIALAIATRPKLVEALAFQALRAEREERRPLQESAPC